MEHHQKRTMGYKGLIDRVFGQGEYEYRPDEDDVKYSESYTFSEEVFVEDVMSTIAPREAEVLYQRHGFNGREFGTLKAIGLQLGVQQERVRQIESKALRKLKHPARSMGLRSNRLLKDVKTEREEKQKVRDAEIAAARAAEIKRLGIEYPDSIDWLELGVRSSNCLKRANINTIGELTSATGRALLKLPNFGRKSLNEIKLALKEKGLVIS